MKVPAYCKCHAKRAVFTCAPKKLDTFSSFRPGQTVTKYCACHTILRVSLKVANHESPTYCKCHAKRAVFTCAPKKLHTFSSSRTRPDRHKVLCLPHNSTRQPESSQSWKSQRTVNAMQNEPCSLAHLKSYTLSVPSAQVRPSQSIVPAAQFYASGFRPPIKSPSVL